MIRDLEKYSRSAWNWDFLIPCFEGSKIRISDGDGEIEHNGWFLRFETKGPGVTLPTGQRILLEAYAREPNKTVIVVWGENEQPTRIWRPPDEEAQDCTVETFKAMVADWYRFAASGRFPAGFWLAAKRVLRQRGIPLPSDRKLQLLPVPETTPHGRLNRKEDEEEWVRILNSEFENTQRLKEWVKRGEN